MPHWGFEQPPESERVWGGLRTETITKGFNEAQEGRFAGKDLKSLDALVEELRAEA